MTFKSIKWRLQIWYGLILVVVLTGFGFTAYELERGRQFGRIDDELKRRVGIIANALHHPPPHRLNHGRPPFDRLPPDQIPDGAQPEPDNFRPAGEFHLPLQVAGMFDAGSPNNFYYILKSRNGEELARSTNAPDQATVAPGRVAPDLMNAPPGPLRPHLNRPRLPIEFGNYREVIQTLPSGETIWVGCSIAPEWKELHRTALKLMGVGGIILFLGLAGGWWIASRAIHPIEAISATAVKISAGDLSQRINVAETESELGRLAAVLNSTFARLDTAFAQQRQFTSDAAHELRTPVSVMLTQTQTILNRDRNAAEYRETLEACQRAAQRMRRLIESLLALARLDAGQEPMKRLAFDFSQTVRDCVELVRPLADERGVKIDCDLAPLEFAGDSERLAQVITNLLTNAIQYNRENGTVRVAVQLQNGTVILTVNDTGQGIAAAHLPHIFERFYRADPSRSSSHAGLGLAISKAIVEAHGGVIEVAGEENVGTTFTVRLPT
jgi:two-component system, OmpR family, sensor kinase